jgi:hypothetical protein
MAGGSLESELEQADTDPAAPAATDNHEAHLRRSMLSLAE